VLDRVNYPGMSVYAGRGVGGGSLVNGGMAVTPRRSYFEEILPEVDAAEMYGQWFPLANRMLGVNSVDPAWLETAKCYRYARVSRDHAIKAGYKTVFVPSVYDMGYLAREDLGQVTRSATAQEILYGNNHGKCSLDQSYLADAVGTGRVHIYTLSEVLRMELDANGDHVLTIKQINPQGVEQGRSTLRCQSLFLAGGSTGTSSLLVRARDTGTLPKLNAEVGAGWGHNGNVMAARNNQLRYTTGAVQSTMPLMGIDDWDHPTRPVFAEITPLPTGFENWISMYPGLEAEPERGERGGSEGADRPDQRPARHPLPHRPVRRRQDGGRRLLLPPAGRLCAGQGHGQHRPGQGLQAAVCGGWLADPGLDRGQPVRDDHGAGGAQPGAHPERGLRANGTGGVRHGPRGVNKVTT